MPKRCGWVKMNNPLYVAYHDEEWGQPLHDDRALFELLCMETYQAGLSWETVLNKRQGFRQAFHGYQVQRVADMTDEELEVLMDKPSSMMCLTTARRLPKQLYLRNYPKISKNVVSSLQVPLRSYPTYKLQVWLMIMRMIVNGKAEISDVR